MTTSSKRVVYWGTGRRKTAVARVRVVPGSGSITINGRPGDNYLNFNPAYISAVMAPLETLGLPKTTTCWSMFTEVGLQDRQTPSSRVQPGLSVNCPLTTANPSRVKVTSAVIHGPRSAASMA